ncbi:hypothetical protein NO1_0569 [Candidatus Termititenax aidoneus]|uniref:Uncharacterized protein n=1 Tax=Termititenax aidoneus TaxID=2218524 RepID=A0A388T9C2_TERA1|nr:hypothetical protein NO1_0569 [Candidatus Termititenax aidoneus]
MTRWECLTWANSKDSYGWLVKQQADFDWALPQHYGYSCDLSLYVRARLLPDGTGIDENTLTDFSVEVDDGK